MTEAVSNKGFNRIDFEQTKAIAAQVGFDILACACKKKSCGPGSDWLVQDKRYYTLMLLQHIKALLHDCCAVVPDTVRAWYEYASLAAKEYAEIEEKIYPVLQIKRKSKGLPD